MKVVIGNNEKEYTWSHTQPKPKFPVVQAAVSIVTALQADGTDLAFLRMTFNNLPMTALNDTCTWRYHMAQFIYDNL